MPKFEIERYIEQSKKFDASFIKLYQLLIDGFDSLKSSQFQQITFEMNMIKLSEFRPVTPLSDILKFVNKLSNTINENPNTKKIEVDLFGMIRGDKSIKENEIKRVANTETQIIEKEEIEEQDDGNASSLIHEDNGGRSNATSVVAKDDGIASSLIQEDNGGRSTATTVADVAVLHPPKEIEKQDDGNTSSLIHEDDGGRSNATTVADVAVLHPPKEKEKLQLPEIIDFEAYKKLVKPFFDMSDMSYQYFYQQVKIPASYKDNTLVLEYPIDAEILFNLHPEFKLKYETWLKSVVSDDLIVKIKMGLVENSDSFDGIEKKNKKESDKREIDTIRDLEGVRKVEEVFNLKVKKIIRSEENDKSKEKK
jgi:hypothetical protein